MKYVLALDIGTTSIKTSIVDENLKIVNSISTEIDLITADGGIVELEVTKYWGLIVNCLNLLVENNPDIALNIEAITCSSFAETVMPVDINGKPVCNAIIWYDSRASNECRYILEHISNDEYYLNTGIKKISEIVPASKLLWFKNNRPDKYKSTYKFLQIEDYIIHKLSGKFVTDVSIISGSGYFDINNGRYWNRMLDVIGIPENYFPSILPCGKIVGKITPEASEELKINPNAVVTTGALDQVCAAIGSGNISPGIICESLGTAMAVFTVIEKPYYRNRRKPLYYKSYNDKYMALALSRTAGIILKWFKDEFLKEEVKSCMESNKNIFDLMGESVINVPAGSGSVMTIPYFIGKITPEENNNVKGAFVGISIDTKRDYFIRSIMESIAYMLRENIEMFKDMGIEVNEVICLGGGSRCDVWNSIKASVCNIGIKTLQYYEAATLGAAILGSVAIRLYESVEQAVERIVSVKKEYKPDNALTVKYEKFYKKYLILSEKIIEYYEKVEVNNL